MHDMSPAPFCPKGLVAGAGSCMAGAGVGPLAFPGAERPQAGGSCAHGVSMGTRSRNAALDFPRQRPKGTRALLGPGPRQQGFRGLPGVPRCVRGRRPLVGTVFAAWAAGAARLPAGPVGAIRTPLWAGMQSTAQGTQSLTVSWRCPGGGGAPDSAGRSLLTLHVSNHCSGAITNVQ